MFRNAKAAVDFYKMFLCVHEIPVPTIACINGTAAGGGMCLALACDVRIIASTAKIGFPFPKLGIHPGMGASVLLPRLIASQQATFLLLSGRFLTGTEAVDSGLALTHVEKDSVFDASLQYAKDMTTGSPIATQSCLATLRQAKVRLSLR